MKDMLSILFLRQTIKVTRIVSLGTKITVLSLML